MRQKITLSKVIQSHPRGRGSLIWQLCSRGKVLFSLPSFFPSSLPGQMYKSRGGRGRGLPSCMFIVCSSCLLLLSSPLLSLSSPYKCLGEKGAPRKETRKKGRVVGKKKTLFTSPSSFFGRRRRGEERGKRWHFPPFFPPSFLIVPLKGGSGKEEKASSFGRSPVSTDGREVAVPPTANGDERRDSPKTKWFIQSKPT